MLRRIYGVSGVLNFYSVEESISNSAQAGAKQSSFSIDLGDHGLQQLRTGNVAFRFLSDTHGCAMFLKINAFVLSMMEDITRFTLYKKDLIILTFHLCITANQKTTRDITSSVR